ncbi:amidohydrolase family protein [Pseudidiomarina terrestris]|uniref:amidohydrolase family protein n=1 Tax=Pseudidiomarina terrestris TaxID=2820060 RepID=UPI00265A236F|nr:amidohydrolase family protein [Pseudidiomarina sp. 1APR75-33.1]
MLRMYKTLLLSFSLLLLGCYQAADVAQSQPANGQSSVPPDTLVTNVQVVIWQEQQAQLLRNASIAIKDGVIVDVTSQPDPMLTGAATETIDGKGAYAMAGFTEMHGHVPAAVNFGGMPETYADDMLFLYIANGVTTVRGMLGYTRQLQLKKDIASGQRIGPNLFLAGPSFNDSTVASPEQAAARVREHVAEGWDLLKIHPGLELAEYRAVAAAARAEGIDFAGHVPVAVGIDVAMAEGQRTIDHLDGYLRYVDASNRPITASELDALVELTLAHNTAVVPTQALWATLIGAGDAVALANYPELALVPERVREGWLDYYPSRGSSYFNTDNAAVQQDNRRQLLQALYEGGATIIFGTDAPQLFSVPGYSIHHEIRYMQAAGMPLEAIYYSATVAAGDYFDDDDSGVRIGHIASGYQADFMLLKDNPLASAAALQEPQGVMVRGQWFDRANLDARIAEIRARYASP